jgi:hypothetical protein
MFRQAGALVSSLGLAVVVILPEGAAHASPRPPVPPWPGGGLLYSESFDQPYDRAAGQRLDPSVWTESWSGYALNRSSEQPLVAPWVVPVVATNGNWNIDPQRGALRFWYQPDGGLGGGSVATLLTMVSSNGTSDGAVRWTLVVSPDGQSILLVCPTGGGLEVCLSAPAALPAGTCCLLTLAYSETNTALFVNDQQVGAGYGLPSVATLVGPSTSLVLGSTLGGGLVACGRIESFTAFTSRPRFRHDLVFDPRWDIAEYYAVYGGLAALGPLDEAEIAAQREARALQRAAVPTPMLRPAQPSTMAAGGTLGPMEASGCVTGGPVYITNAACAFDAGSGWTVWLTIVGGTNGVPWDIFRAESLGAGSVTNWVWAHLDQGYPCNIYSFTNQPEDQGFYMLGDAADPDEDGLGTAFELLVSHSDPAQWSTRGDGIGDRTAYLQGRNPRVPGTVPDTNGAINLLVYTPLK